MVLKVLFLLRATTAATLNTFSFPRTSLHKEASFMQNKRRAQSYSAKCGLEPPDVLRLAETARISLTPNQVEDFAPKIQQVVDWFGQLQAVDLQSIEPAIRADTEDDNLRDDLPETFQNREAMIAAVPNYDEPFIKVPPVLNKE